MRLFQITVDDVERIRECATLCCLEHGDYKLGGPLNWEHYKKVWEGIIASGDGTIFAYEKEDGEFVGGLGCRHYPNIHTGKLRAAQIFMYLKPEHRGALSISRLVNAFENWAIEQKCHDTILPHEYRGYRPVQTLFTKPTGISL